MTKSNRSEIIDVLRDLSGNKHHAVVWKELPDYDEEIKEELK